jgi:hypothetical protein
LLNIRAENATFNGILIGSVFMTEILVVPGPGTASNPQTSISVVGNAMEMP